MAISDFLSPANGFTTQNTILTGIVTTSAIYTEKNYSVGKDNLRVNSHNLEISKEILDINRRILQITDEHLTDKELEKVYESINTLCDLQRKNNELLEKLISLQGGENK